MKNKTINLKNLFTTLTGVMSVAILAGCGQGGTLTIDQEDAVLTFNRNGDSGLEVNVSNPWVTTDASTILDATGIYITSPEGATDVTYSYLTTNNMAQATYTYDNQEWTFRIQNSDYLLDISGLYYDWGSVEEGFVSGKEAYYYGYSETNDTGMLDDLFGIQLVNWYDEYTGCTYSLSVEGTEIGGLDIEVFAEELFDNYYAGEPEASDIEAPHNDIEARVNRNTFESYDDIIGLLESGEGYTYLNVDGYDDEVLAITSFTFDDQEGHMASTECTLYTPDKDGVYCADTILYSGGTTNPISIDDEGIIYVTTHTSLSKYCYGENSIGNLGVMCYAQVYGENLNDNGEPTSIIGSYRTSNSIVNNDNLVQVAEDDIDFYYQMFSDYENAAPINFTVIE